ncbi:MAG: head GIN domain-containing protein [bacterium]
MKTSICTSFLIFGLLGIASCEKIKGKGEVISQIRTVTGYAGINLAIDGEVFFTTDSVYYLEIQAQQNILDVLQTVVEGSGNTLVIQYKHGVHIGSHEPIKIFIAAPNINQMAINGSGDIFVTNPMLSNFLETTISGSGNISISQLEVNEFQATVSGSGNIETTMGAVNYQQLTISGSGNIDQVGVESDTTFANISGSGNISVWVNKLLDATISGSGSVMYKGNPVINSHISGSGTIIKI